MVGEVAVDLGIQRIDLAAEAFKNCCAIMPATPLPQSITIDGFCLS